MSMLPEFKTSDFGRVAVLMGGTSAEREISLESGNAVLNALIESDIDATGIDVNESSILQLIESKFDRAFIALHGRGGEDGKIQGALDSIGIPYTGSGVLASALAMDKLISKSIWRDANLSTPAAFEINSDSDWEVVTKMLGLPIMVKPASEGSSLGATKVTDASMLQAAWEQASQYDNKVMAESWIEGDEYTVPILNDNVLPVIKLETRREFYDYQAKYVDDDTSYICPCGLDEEIEKLLADISLQACNVLGVSGWSRVDMMLDNSGHSWLIEVNTVPGMTSHSLVPMAANQAGISFQELVVQILATSLSNQRSHQELAN